MPTLGLGGSGSGGPLAWNPARQKPRALWSEASGGDGTPAIPGGPSVLMPMARPGEHGHRRATGGAAIPARMVPWTGGAFPAVPGGRPPCFSSWDIGGCGCNACSPCVLPAANLTLSWRFGCGATGVVVITTGTAALAYQGVVAGVPTWQTACFATGQPAPCFPSARVSIFCYNGTGGVLGTTYQVREWALAGCAGVNSNSTIGWNTVTGNAGFSGVLLPVSMACSPLNLHLAWGTAWDLVITP